MINDLNSFLAGVQVGLRLKVWEANATPRPVPSQNYIITEYDEDITDESGEVLITE